MAQRGSTNEWILTHGSRAHRDEFMAACYVLAMSTEPMDIVRRNRVFGYELNDPRIWVLDAGRVYEPDRHNFDHHQQGSDLDKCECALTLIMRYFNLLEAATKVSPWLKLTAICDCFGVPAGAKYLGLTTFEFAKTQSPVERPTLELFSQQELWRADSYMVQFMTALGRQHMKSVSDYTQRISLLRRSARLIDLTPDGAKLHVVDLPKLTNPSLAMSGFRYEQSVAGTRIAVSASPDEYGTGWMVYDYGTNWWVDLGLMLGNTKVQELHENHFVVRVSEKVSIEELTNLVKLAVLTIPNKRRNELNESALGQVEED